MFSVIRRPLYEVMWQADSAGASSYEDVEDEVVEDEVAEEGDDKPKKDPETPKVYDDSDDEFEVVEDEEEEEGDNADEDDSQTSALVEGLSQILSRQSDDVRSSNKDVQDAITRLANTLEEREKPKQPQRTKEDREKELQEAVKKAKEKEFDSPIDAVMDVLPTLLKQHDEEAIAPALQQMFGMHTKTAASVSRQQAQQDEVYAYILKHHEDEVEQKVKEYEGQPDAYSRACGDVLTERRKDVFEGLMEEQRKGRRKASRPKNSSPSSRTGHGQTKPTTTSPDGKARVTSKDRAKIAKFAYDRGVTEQDAYEYLTEKGIIKRR